MFIYASNRIEFHLINTQVSLSQMHKRHIKRKMKYIIINILTEREIIKSLIVEAKQLMSSMKYNRWLQPWKILLMYNVMEHKYLLLEKDQLYHIRFELKLYYLFQQLRLLNTEIRIASSLYSNEDVFQPLYYNPSENIWHLEGPLLTQYDKNEKEIYTFDNIYISKERTRQYSSGLFAYNQHNELIKTTAKYTTLSRLYDKHKSRINITAYKIALCKQKMDRIIDHMIDYYNTCAAYVSAFRNHTLMIADPRNKQATKNRENRNSPSRDAVSVIKKVYKYGDEVKYHELFYILIDEIQILVSRVDLTGIPPTGYNILEIFSIMNLRAAIKWYNISASSKLAVGPVRQRLVEADRRIRRFKRLGEFTSYVICEITKLFKTHSRKSASMMSKILATTINTAIKPTSYAVEQQCKVFTNISKDNIVNLDDIIRTQSLDIKHVRIKHHFSQLIYDIKTQLAYNRESIAEETNDEFDQNDKYDYVSKRLYGWY